MSINDDNKAYLAVADGIDWRFDSVDPVQFPRSLMTENKNIINSDTSDNKSYNEMSQEAYAVLRNEHDNGKRHYGTSARIDMDSGETKISNIGDSAFAILRLKELIFNTKIALKDFNCHYQIGLEMRGLQLYLDCKSDNQYYHRKLESGDKFILATDGVWDAMSFLMAAGPMRTTKCLSNIGADIWNDNRANLLRYDTDLVPK